MTSLGLAPNVFSGQPSANAPGSMFLSGGFPPAKNWGPAPQASPEATVQKFLEVDSLTSEPMTRIGTPAGVNFCTRFRPRSTTQMSPLPEAELSTAIAAGLESWPMPEPASPALHTSVEGGFASQTSSGGPPW